MALLLFLGMGAVSLWSLASEPFLWVGLDSRKRLGAVMGHVAIQRFLLRLGAVASELRLERWGRTDLVWIRRERQFWVWPRIELLFLGSQPVFLPSAPLPLLRDACSRLDHL